MSVGLLEVLGGTLISRNMLGGIARLSWQKGAS